DGQKLSNFAWLCQAATSRQYSQKLTDIFQNSIRSLEITALRQVGRHNDAADAGCPGGLEAARRILDGHARLRRKAAPLDGPQVRFRVRLDPREVAGRQH